MEGVLVSNPDQYAACIDSFRRSCAELKDDVVSLLLYGSLARGDAVSGHSDVLDAVVVLRSGVLEDEQRFYHALDIMVDANRELAASGLPFHPFHYFTREEMGICYSARYIESWRSDRFSKVLAAEDVRPQIRSVDNDLSFTGGCFFGGRRTFQRLWRHRKRRKDDRWKTDVLREITRFVKTMPLLACFACETPVDASEAIDTIEKLLPEIGAGPFRLLDETRRGRPEAMSTAQVESALLKTLELNEALCKAVVERLRQSGPEWTERLGL
jgi:predicted nucleotidyltransferase